MPLLDADTASSPLDNRRILRFFWPLALSWLFMSVEGPACVGFISRLPDAVLHTAAFNLLMSIALFLESPVIDLLSTSTTLAANRSDYLTLRRFVVALMFFETALHAVFVLSPVFDAVTLDLMGIPKEIAATARTGLIWMIPWSAFIGWRRFHQGILIRFGKTRAVGAGTFVRMATLFGVSTVLLVVGVRSGAVLAGAGLISSVFAEAVYAWTVTRPVVKSHLTTDSDDRPRLTVGKLCRFHFPLTATTMVMFVGGPIISSALARSPDGAISMAAWQVASSVLWVTRAVVYALPEIVITLGRTGKQSLGTLWGFCLKTGTVCSIVVLAAWVLQLDRWVFAVPLDAAPSTIDPARLGFILGLPLPLIVAAQSFLRGVLTLQHRTGARLYAIVVGISALFLAIQATPAIGFSGIQSVAMAMVVAQLAELGALWLFSRFGGNRKPMVTRLEEMP